MVWEAEMIVELTLILCLKAPQLGCREVRMPMPSIQQCMVDGQNQAAQWLLAHADEGYELDRWRCSSGKDL